MRTVDAVLFDKTGTLTKGRPQVTGVATTDGGDDGELLRLAGAVEADSEHPLARAIVAAAEAAGGAARASGFRAMTGRGVQATVDGATVAVGGPALLRELDLAEPKTLSEELDGWRGRGAAVLYVSATARWPGRWPWRTRSGPSPARPSPSCTAWAGGW